jgi:hypothetical protein
MFKSLATGFLTFWSLVGGCPYSNQDCHDCSSFKYKIKKIGHLPDEIKESSGLLRLNDLFLTHGDSGNDPILYGFKYPFDTDSIQGEIRIEGVENHDWEDLAFDNKNRIFIGDLGNNLNNRKNLQIIIHDYQEEQSRAISISYMDQKAYPPGKSRNQNFDSEAIFWYMDRLYFVSKNKRPGHTKIYSLADSLPDQSIAPYDSIRLKKSYVTSADINPDGSEVALLSYGKVLFLNVKESETGLLHFSPKSCKRFGRSGQAESIIYLDNDNLMITNEKGKVYLLYRNNKSDLKERNKNSVENIFIQVIDKEDLIVN